VRILAGTGNMPPSPTLPIAIPTTISYVLARGIKNPWQNYVIASLPIGKKRRIRIRFSVFTIYKVQFVLSRESYSHRSSPTLKIFTIEDVNYQGLP